MAIEFGDDLDQKAEKPVSELERVRILAKLLSTQMETVARLDDELKVAKANVMRTEREDLPALMTELELTEFTLLDGSKVEVKPDVACGIPKALHNKAIEWLKANEFGGLIKHQVIVSFTREEEEQAKEFTDYVLDEHIGAPEIKEFVHPATLKSFVKEQMEAGKSPPAELFGIFPYSVAKITQPKKGK
jgi:hypothetical protein